MSFPDDAFGDVRHKYQNDVTFHAIVDTLRSMLCGSHTTPSELREALMLAAYMHEMDNPRPVYIRLENFAKELLAGMQKGERR